MDKREIDLLEVLSSNDTPTQREIANQTGISLGMVNNLIKKCAKKGFLKIKKVSGNNIRYILTYKGIKRISEQSLNYFKKSYRAIKYLTNTLSKQIKIDLKADRDIYLYGPNDEVYQLIESVLTDYSINFEVIEDLENHDNLINSTIYYWDPDYFEELNATEANIYNVINPES